MTVRNIYNYHLSPSVERKTSKVSLTQPDMAYTPKQLMQRMENGLSLTKTTNMSYHKDIQIPDPRTLDLVDMEELLQVSAEDLKKKYADYKQQYEQRQAAQKASIETLFEQLLAKRSEAEHKAKSATTAS